MDFIGTQLDLFDTTEKGFQSMREWITETRKISELKPYHKNPRKMTAKQAEDIQKSIEKFGLTDKPLIQPDGTIIGGHQRVKVLKKMGYKEVPVLVADPALTEEEIEEAVIRHNKNTGEWDWEVLANEWNMPDLIDWGFEEKDIFGIADIIEDEDLEEDKPKKCKMCPHCGKEID